MTMAGRYLPDGTRISLLGFGCSSFWAKPGFPEDQAIALVLRAHALGINHFDTGPSYAAGEAERRLGLALRQLDRRSVVISTKVGTYADADGRQTRSFEPARIRSSLQDSLDRLGLAHVDILYLHGPDLADLSTGVIDCLVDLKKRGLARYIGVNSFNSAVLRKLIGMPIDVVMPQYNIFDVGCREEIASLSRDGKVIISATALGQGIFNWRMLFPTSKKGLWYLLRTLKNDPLFPLTVLGARRRIAAIGRPPLESALQFLAGTPEITSAVFGTTSTRHLEQNVRAASGAGQ